MAVGLKAPPAPLPVAGIRVGTAAAGIRHPNRRDLALWALDPGTVTAAVFTRNAFRAAPVTVAQWHLGARVPRFWLANAGNANAGNGQAGVEDAIACCRALAARGGVAMEEVLPFSTGVIGQRLPLERFDPALESALAALNADGEGWLAGAQAIMTTDTVAKVTSRRFPVGDRECTLTGCAKGSGMIRPDMATLLAFLATDAAVAPAVLAACLRRAVDASFNRITVDGDTSTNDACVLAATGASGAPSIDTDSGADFRALESALASLCLELAQSVVRDGEGATKFITVDVGGGRDEAECRRVADAVAHSPLVKTAMFASDPNWGRILAAIGRAGVKDLDIGAVRVRLGDVELVRDGGVAPGYTEAEGQRVMSGDEIEVAVDLARGSARVTVWTCDLSYDYVRINAEYRT